VTRTADEDLDDVETVAEPMVAVYRHDLHKMRGRSHEAAVDVYADVQVNEPVPLGADRDAALLSRLRGEPEETVSNHKSPYRLSLLAGSTPRPDDPGPSEHGLGFQDLVKSSDPEELHARWVTSDIAGAYHESMFVPYTSLKHHTLLAAALLDNYRAGHGFDDLYLVATNPGDDDVTDVSSALSAESVVPHRTVLWTPEIALYVTVEPGDRPAARLGDTPAMSFADTWSRLSGHPLDVGGEERWRMLDAELRRIRSWSTALAFIEDFVGLHGDAA